LRDRGAPSKTPGSHDRDGRLVVFARLVQPPGREERVVARGTGDLHGHPHRTTAEHILQVHTTICRVVGDD
jgi:hypothetical protein